MKNFTRRLLGRNIILWQSIAPDPYAAIVAIRKFVNKHYHNLFPPIIQYPCIFYFENPVNQLSFRVMPSLRGMKVYFC